MLYQYLCGEIHQCFTFYVDWVWSSLMRGVCDTWDTSHANHAVYGWRNVGHVTTTWFMTWLRVTRPSGYWAYRWLASLFTHPSTTGHPFKCLHLGALKSKTSQTPLWVIYTSFNVWVRYFVWNFKGYLWNSTQHIFPIHWKICFLYNIAVLKTLRFKSSWALLKCPLVVYGCHMHMASVCVTQASDKL